MGKLMFAGKKNAFVMLFMLLMAGILSLLIAEIFTQNYIRHLQIRRELANKQAQRNALFAMNLAIARLQKFAGQDNVISARAGNYEEIASPNANNIGIWETSMQNAVYNNHFKCWLTAEYDSNNFFSAAGKTSNTQNVCLIKNNSYAIFAPKRTIKNNEFLKWSFWIDDESQKIDLSLTDMHENSKASYVQQTCSQYAGIEHVTAISLKHKSNLKVYKNIDFLEQVSLIDRDLGTNVIQNNNLYTPHSYGVLSKTNGLKTDLTQFLSGQQFHSTDYIFPGKNILPAPPPTWKFLQSFHDLHIRTHQDRIQISPTFPMYHPLYKQDYLARTLANLGADLQAPLNHGIYPIISQLNFSIITEIVDSELIVKVCPKFALWNPYNISLQQADYELDINIYPEEFIIKILPQADFRKKIQNSKFPQALTIDLNPNKSGQLFHNFFALKFSAKFEPGEVKIFSLQSDSQSSENFLSNVTSGDYDNFFIKKTKIFTKNGSFYAHRENISSNPGNFDIDYGSEIEFSPTTYNSNEFFIKLTSLADQTTCQEVAQLSTKSNISWNKTTLRSSDRQKTIASFSAHLRIADMKDAKGNHGVRWLSFCNPRAPYLNRSVFQDPASIFSEQNFIPSNWSWKVKFKPTAAKIDYNHANFLNGLILFDLPHKNYGILNLAFLRHVNWTPFGYLPTFCVGNSFHNPYLPAGETYFENNAQKSIWPSHNKVESLFDYSYLLNEKLFDNFFCSTLQKNSQHPINQRFLNLSKQASGVAAEHLLVRGNFNVHTNSHEPWLAYLASITDGQGNIIFPRFFNQEKTKLPCQKFSNSDITNLAKCIVNLIKKRHLFETLGAFINRQLNGENYVHGLLQQAIFDAKFNKNSQKQFVTFRKNKPWFNDKSASGYLEDGLPNVVDQSDILQTMSHFISVRGDTFKIIAYGECEDKNSRTTIASRKCEVVVQRVPEFVNPKENSPSDTNLSPINQALGRRFKVILFRWL